MKIRFSARVLLTGILAIGSCTAIATADDKPAAEAPRVNLDKSPRVVAYQLKRLSDPQLLLVERKTDDPKYKPVYEAILTRKGMDKKSREDALAALATIDKSSPVVDLLDAIGKVDAEDKTTPRELASLLMAQKPSDLSAQREKIQSMATDSESDLVKQAAYAALAAGDGSPEKAWELASSKDALKHLLAGIPLIHDPKVRSSFFPLVNPLVAKAKDDDTRQAAIEAISSIPGHEVDAFKELADIITTGTGPIRDAAVRSLRRIPDKYWPQEQIEPLAKAVVKMVQTTPTADRTSAETAQAVQLGNDLADNLDPAQGAVYRKTLRGLVIPVILVRTLREQMLYDTKYFVVQAGKPVKIILENDDFMPHNMVITRPGKFMAVAEAGAPILPKDADDRKAYIPETPDVIASLDLIPADETATTTFTAPTQPGEYNFTCTFPGHAQRMYGVMLVVPDLDAYEAKPQPPMDPIAKQPYESQKNEAGEGMPPMEHQH
jgi:azurin